MIEIQKKLQATLNLRCQDVDFSQEHKAQWYGKTGSRSDSGRCTECNGSHFRYDNGMHWSEDGIRGYRCENCKTIKPALPSDFNPFPQ